MPLNPDFGGFCLPLRSASSSDVRRAVKGSKPVVVKFHSPGCGSCVAAGPEIQKAACPHREEVEFLEVDIDTDPELAEEIGVKAIPFVAAFKDGQLVSKKVGAAEAPEYSKFFERLRKKKK